MLEPIMTLDNNDSANLLRFVSCNCSGDGATKRCSCKKNNVKYISACGGCHGILCKNNEIEVPLLESDWIKQFQIVLVQLITVILNLVILNPYHLC